jgi:glycosyltransferase involved in cell wall biosynthesis
MPEPPELPPIARAPISVVLVSRNREASIENILDGWIASLCSLDRDFEVIFIGDGSTDQTLARARGHSQFEPRLRVLASSEPGGIGAALRLGIASAIHPLLVYAEADPGYQPAEIKPFLDVVDRVHVVSGVRMSSARRSWRERVYQLGLRLFFGVRLRDVECFFKLYRREVFARIPIQSDGPFVHGEIIAKANFLGYMMTDVPFPYTPDGTGAAQAFSLRERYQDAKRVFRHPDFGPAVLPTCDETPSDVRADQKEAESNC